MHESGDPDTNGYSLTCDVLRTVGPKTVYYLKGKVNGQVISGKMILRSDEMGWDYQPDPGTFDAGNDPEGILHVLLDICDSESPVI